MISEQWAVFFFHPDFLLSSFHFLYTLKQVSKAQPYNIHLYAVPTVVLQTPVKWSARWQRKVHLLYFCLYSNTYIGVCR